MKSTRNELLDGLALILATTQQDSVALTAFKLMRKLHPRGSLFVVQPITLQNDRGTVQLDDIRHQVWRDLDLGVPYYKIAIALRVDHRKIKLLKDEWDRLLPEAQEYRRERWSAERKARSNLIEDARDLVNRGVVDRLRPTLEGDDQHVGLTTEDC